MQQATASTSPIDLEAFARAPLVETPFPFVIVPKFLRPETLKRVIADFPEIPKGGSFPPAGLAIGPACRDLVEALQGPEMRDAVSRKFGIDLTGRPTMVTFRGEVRPRDGKIHADSRTKLISVLVYLNETWEAPGGRLRLLRSRDRIEDVAAEVAPVSGNLVAFRVGPDSWHGHTSASGVRRSIQLNWVTDEGVLRRELARHGFSARLKRLIPFFGEY